MAIYFIFLTYYSPLLARGNYCFGSLDTFIAGSKVMDKANSWGCPMSKVNVKDMGVEDLDMTGHVWPVG